MILQEKIEYWRSLHPLDLDLEDVIDTFSKELEAFRERIRELESAKPINGDDIINALNNAHNTLDD